MAKGSVIRAEVEGGAFLLRRLQSLPDAAAGSALERAAHEGARPIQDAAARFAPRRTGRLSREIGRETVEATRHVATVAVGPERDAFYGLFAELGTEHQDAEPFLRPAFDTMERRARAAAERELRAELLGWVRRGL